jgi:hypothetical protein
MGRPPGSVTLPERVHTSDLGVAALTLSAKALRHIASASVTPTPRGIVLNMISPGSSGARHRPPRGGGGERSIGYGIRAERAEASGEERGSANVGEPLVQLGEREPGSCTDPGTIGQQPDGSL